MTASKITPDMLRMYIIDDDNISCVVTKARVQAKFPNSRVTIMNKPTVIPNGHIYIIDNNFDGSEHALHLLRDIRKQLPDALVIVMSSTLTIDNIINLTNNGCDAVCDKQQQSHLDEIFIIMNEYINAMEEAISSHSSNPITHAANIIGRLLNRWNIRLQAEAIRHKNEPQ
jgi:DNA-binding NarL/FixJ family response regulator